MSQSLEIKVQVLSSINRVSVRSLETGKSLISSSTTSARLGRSKNDQGSELIMYDYVSETGFDGLPGTLSAAMKDNAKAEEEVYRLETSILDKRLEIPLYDNGSAEQKTINYSIDSNLSLEADLLRSIRCQMYCVLDGKTFYSKRQAEGSPETFETQLIAETEKVRERIEFLKEYMQKGEDNEQKAPIPNVPVQEVKPDANAYAEVIYYKFYREFALSVTPDNALDSMKDAITETISGMMPYFCSLEKGDELSDYEVEFMRVYQDKIMNNCKFMFNKFDGIVKKGELVGLETHIETLKPAAQAYERTFIQMLDQKREK